MEPKTWRWADEPELTLYLDVFQQDKSKWERGPWDDEPDKEQWTDEATGLPCLIVRGPFGALNGYIGVLKGHPWFGLYMDALGGVSVHGGVTFCGFGQEGYEAACVRIAPGPGDRVDLWYVGFDCGHAWDVQPGMDCLLISMDSTPVRGFGETYRPIGYVKSEVTGLAAQAAEAAIIDIHEEAFPRDE